MGKHEERAGNIIPVEFFIFASMGTNTREANRKNMQANKATGTKAEVMLAKALFARGLRYRKNNKTVFGKPDITFKPIKLAIFVDGEFWHGKDWDVRKKDHKTNQEFWIKKIERNRQRDLEVNQELKRQGWRILRFWAKDVEKNLETFADLIAAEVQNLRGMALAEKPGLRNVYPSSKLLSTPTNTSTHVNTLLTTVSADEHRYAPRFSAKEVEAAEDRPPYSISKTPDKSITQPENKNENQRQ